jgi:hypothetical protein
MRDLKHEKAKTENMQNSVDIVIIWVDGGDQDWQKEKLKHSGVEASKSNIDDSAHRYRDWDNLQYLFRGIEEFAPWVRKVHLVTSGHFPVWLNLESEKLNFVKHEDYIPEEYLPTFSSNPIELNLHRIKDLSEKFIFFNDDMFITKPMKETDFFVNGLPCDMAILNRITSTNPSDAFPHLLLNNLGAINKNFNKNSVLKKFFFKWFSPKYGVTSLMKSMLLLPYKDFSGFSTYHMPSPFLKSTFNEVWGEEPSLLAATSSHKFRHIQDVNQYLMKIWQMASGNFYPSNIKKIGKVFSRFPLESNELESAIRSQRYSMVCVNDTEACDNFEEVRDGLIQSFETILPNKSSFEI